MKTKNLITSLCCLLSISTLAAQSKDAPQELSSPLMMSRHGEEIKKQDLSSAAEEQRERTADANRSHPNLQEAVLPSSLPPVRQTPTEEELYQEMVSTVKQTVGFDAATELHQEKWEAQHRYSDAVSERVLLEQVPQLASVRFKEAQQQFALKRQVHQKGVRGYVWSNHDFSTWELPGELPEVIIPPGDPSIIVPPEVLHEAAVVMGRKVLAEEYRLKNLPRDEDVKMYDPSQSASISAELPLDVEEEIKNAIIAESLSLLEEKQRGVEERLEARARANALYQRAAVLAKESRRLREAKANANEKASAADEGGSAWSNISSRVFGAFSRTNTTAEVASGGPAVDFEVVNKLADEAEQEWETLTFQAKQPDIHSSKQALGKQKMLRIWKRADQKILQLTAKENAAKSLGEKWKENVGRWQACVQAEELEQQQRQIQEDLSRSQERKSILMQKDIAGKVSEEELEKNKCNISAITEKNAVLQSALQEAYARWQCFALEQEEIRNLAGEEQRQAIQQLRSTDQAVVDLWFKLTDSYSEDDSLENLTQEAIQEKIKQESDRYELKRKTDLARCFGEGSKLGLVLVDAKRFYRQRNKAAAQALYDRANQLEAAACQEYKEVVKQDALESARKRLPELAALWLQRMSTAQAEQQVRATAVHFKKTSLDEWTGEVQQALQHATAIATAEETGFHIYQEEERRLNDIETLFIAIIAAKKEALRVRPTKAAESYFGGDPTAWSNLSVKEREEYNQEIREENKKYEASFEDEIEIAEESLARAYEKVSKALLYADHNDTQGLIDAEDHLASIQAIGEERMKAIQWTLWQGLPLQEKEKKWIHEKETYAQAQRAKRWEKLTTDQKKQEALRLSNKTKRVMNEISAFDAQMKGLPADQRVILMDRMIEKEPVMETMLDQTIAAYKQALKEPSILVKDWWQFQLDGAEYSKSRCSGMILVVKAIRAHIIMHFALKEAEKASAAEKKTCYEQATEKRDEALAVWQQLINFLNAKLQSVPAHWSWAYRMEFEKFLKSTLQMAEEKSQKIHENYCRRLIGK